MLVRRAIHLVLGILLFVFVGCSTSPRVSGKWRSEIPPTEGHTITAIFTADFVGDGTVVLSSEARDAKGDFRNNSRGLYTWSLPDARHMKLVNKETGKELYWEFSLSGDTMRLGDSTYERMKN